MIIDKNLSFKTYEEEIINNNKIFKYVCPKCGAKHSLTRHCTYPRNICYLDGMNIVILEEKLIVQRLLCTSCDSTHAILPDDIIPYKTFTESTISYILKQYFVFKESISNISTKVNMSYQYIKSIIYKAMWFIKSIFIFLRSLGIEVTLLDLSDNIFKLMYSHFNDVKRLSIEYFENQQWHFLMTKFFNRKFNENLSVPIYMKLYF